MKKDMRTTFMKEIQKELKNNGYDSFIGGSYRFGFERDTSDVDIFVNAGFSSHNEDDNELLYRSELINQIFPYGMCHLINNSIGYDSAFCQYQIWNLVHINFYWEIDYNRIKEEHILVEKYLNRHKILKQMRTVAASGTIFYQKILSMAKRERFNKICKKNPSS